MGLIKVWECIAFYVGYFGGNDGAGTIYGIAWLIAKINQNCI